MPKNPDPAVGAYSAPPDPIAGNGGGAPRKGEGKGEGEWRGRGEVERGGVGKGRVGREGVGLSSPPERKSCLWPCAKLEWCCYPTVEKV